MSFGLSQLYRRYVTDPTATLGELDGPVLVWEAVAQRKEKDDSDGLWLLTGTGGPMARPRSGEPLVMPVKKLEGSKNPFAMGVTVGRVDTNDVIVEDKSVSRFHAYFQHDPRKDEWVLVDAESKNGTWLDGMKLSPNTRQVVRDGAQVKFGDCEMRFFRPLSLFKYLGETSGVQVDLAPFQGSKR